MGMLSRQVVLRLLATVTMICYADATNPPGAKCAGCPYVNDMQKLADRSLTYKHLVLAIRNKGWNSSEIAAIEMEPRLLRRLAKKRLANGAESFWFCRHCRSKREKRCRKCKGTGKMKSQWGTNGCPACNCTGK